MWRTYDGSILFWANSRGISLQRRFPNQHRHSQIYRLFPDRKESQKGHEARSVLSREGILPKRLVVTYIRLFLFMAHIVPFRPEIESNDITL